MLFALHVNAQGVDGFFNAIDDINRFGGLEWNNLITQDPNPGPLGGGLLIMVAAGTGYMLTRRKRSRKDSSHMYSVLLLASTMLLGFLQCSKKVDTVITNDNGIPFTLEAYNEAKTSFNESGAISWEANDVIYVVCDGSCIGSATNGAGGGSIFTGSVTGLTSGTEYTLHYYYVGNEQVINVGDNSFAVSFSDQDGTLANLGKYHIGHGLQTITYTGNPISTQAAMTTLVSIGYFDISEMAEVGEKVYMYGANVNNKIYINFSDNSVSNTQVDTEHNNNYISLGAVSAGNNSRYVMLVPNDGAETELKFVSKRTSGTYTFPNGIGSGFFYCKEDGGDKTPLSITKIPYTKGALRGLFTIAENTAIHFSQGNLKAVTTNGWTSFNWYFMDNQYDIVEQTNSDISNEYSGKTTVTLLGWGTSGYAHGATNYKPCNTGTSGSGYKAYNNSWSTLYSSSGTADWGYNIIQNSVNEENKWRTLKKAEYVYLFQTRANAAGKWGYATVNDMHGIIIIPDSFDDPYKNNGSNAFDGSTTGWDANVYDEDNWHNYMEPAGAVFFPAAGQRSGGVFNQTYGGVQIKPGDYGFYWSSDNNSTSNAEALKFVSNSITVTSIEGRGRGHSVRLVLK